MVRVVENIASHLHHTLPLFRFELVTLRCLLSSEVQHVQEEPYKHSRVSKRKAALSRRAVETGSDALLVCCKFNLKYYFITFIAWPQL